MELWFRLLEQGDLVCVPEPVTLIRQHSHQTTRYNQRTGLLVGDKKRIFSAYVNKPYVRRSRLRLFLWRLRTAYNVWSGGGTQTGEFVPPLVFYALLPFIVILHRAGALAGRLRARAKMKALQHSVY